MSEQDVDQFLWELEQHLSHVDGDRRLVLVRQAEARLHELAEKIARRQGDDDLTWTHYVEATAALGPPDRLAAELTGEPLPDKQRTHQRMWIGVGALFVVILLVVGYALWSHGTLVDVGTWQGDGEDLTDQRVYEMNISAQATSVFMSMAVSPTNANGSALVTVLDGGSNLVYEGQATASEHLETVTYLEGDPGTWRVIVDLRTFTGTWKIDGRQELP